MAQKITRQLKNSVNMLPASGARIGETLKTSMVVAISRAASWPVWRSRMIARVITMLAQAPTPWRKRRAIKRLGAGRQAAPDAANDEKRQARNRSAVCGLPDPKSAHREPGTGRPREKSSSGSSAPRRYPPTDRGRWPGKAGRYMSIANGPMAESIPRTMAFRRKADFMRGSFSSHRHKAVRQTCDEPECKRMRRVVLRNVGRGANAVRNPVTVF